MDIFDDLCSRIDRPDRWLALVMLMLVAACDKHVVKQTIEPSDTVTHATQVVTQVARLGPFTHTINSSGRVESISDAVIRVDRSSIVEQILVSNGNMVKAGQVLAILNNEREKLALDKAMVQKKEKELIFTDQVLPYLERDDSVAVAQAISNIRLSSGLEMAEIALKEAQYEYDQTFIRANVDGLISDLQIRPWNVLNPGDQFCRIYDVKHFVVICEILEVDVHRIKVGGKASILTLDRSIKVSGTVAEINPSVNASSHLITTTLSIDDPRVHFFPGMSVLVSLTLSGNKVIIVPKEAVVLKSGRQVVFTKSGPLSKWNDVLLGKDNGLEVEVHSGIKEGDSVIISNNAHLANNSSIRITDL